jgi:hypothetical protein
MSVILLNIETWLQAHELPCMFKAITHFDCPGCGIQRSFILLLKGNITSSFFMYPALIPVLLLFAFLILHVVIKIRGGAEILKFAYIFCAVIILVSYIYKVLFTKTL